METWQQQNSHPKNDPSLSQDRNGDTALHVAAAEDQLEAVLALTRLGADTAATNKTGHTALCVAARLGRAAVVGLLLSLQSASPGELHLDPEGRHALHWAAAAGHPKVNLSYLLRVASELLI